MVIRGKVTQEKLQHIYKTIQSIITNQECYYSDDELEELKKDKKNIFLEEE